MPSGRVHSSTTIVAMATTVETVLILKVSEPIAYESMACFLAGLVLGLIMSPDLDLGQNIHFRRMGKLWQILWWPYAKVLSHRSKLSHWPVLSTIIRLIYLCWLPLSIAFYFGLTIYNQQIFWLMFMLLLGLITSDTAHYYQDLTT